MSLLEQFMVLPSVLAGAGIATLINILLDGRFNKGKRAEAAAFAGEDQATINLLRQQLATAQEQGDKLAEVHAYSRQLEAKIKSLEANVGTPVGGDSDLRVKVLEEQLAEKADLEGKLAVALQQLNDYKAKAEMFDSVVGNEPAPKPAPIEEAPKLVEPIQEAAPVAETAPTVVAEPVVAPEVFNEEPKVEPVIPEPVIAEPIVAVAEAPVEAVAAAPKIEIIENSVPEVTSTSGSSALNPEVATPALRVETVAQPAQSFTNKDPLEKIDGIGQVYQQKLYEAGIQTFAQLAAASPSRITEIIEPQNWQTIDVMKWRREAALFAAGERL